MITENSGMKVDEAIKINPRIFWFALGGLPDRKSTVRCWVTKLYRPLLTIISARRPAHNGIITAQSNRQGFKYYDHDIEEAVLKARATWKTYKRN